MSDDRRRDRDRIDPHELHDRLIKLGEDYADKKAAADLLEQTKKTLLGKITKDNWICGAPSHAIAEKYAFADERYAEHIKEMVKASAAAAKAQVRYETAKTFVELLRTVNANRREELRHLGSVT